MKSMNNQKSIKITISLLPWLLEVADRLAEERSSTRSAVIAELLKKEDEAKIVALMAQGYREWAEENLHEAEEALGLTGDVALRDG